MPRPARSARMVAIRATPVPFPPPTHTPMAQRTEDRGRFGGDLRVGEAVAASWPFPDWAAALHRINDTPRRRADPATPPCGQPPGLSDRRERLRIRVESPLARVWRASGTSSQYSPPRRKSWAGWDSNPRSSDYEPAALPAELPTRRRFSGRPPARRAACLHLAGCGRPLYLQDDELSLGRHLRGRRATGNALKWSIHSGFVADAGAGCGPLPASPLCGCASER